MRNALGATGPNADWVKPHKEFERLGLNESECHAAYRALFDGAIPATQLAAIRDCTHKGWVLGSEKFKAEIEALTLRRASSKGVGRPRVVDAGSAID